MPEQEVEVCHTMMTPDQKWQVPFGWLDYLSFASLMVTPFLI
jgi:hypothetical protein